MTFPSQGLLASYWIPQVGIGPHGSMDYVTVPLTDIRNDQRPDGEMQTNLVFLMTANFISADSPPYFSIPASILQQMTLQEGQQQTNVQQLQQAGIRVLLTVNNNGDYGWDVITDPVGFADWVRDSVIEEYGLDGIDIDDENSTATSQQQFINAVGALRIAMPDRLITKALWQDYDYFTIPVGEGFPNSGVYLGQLLDLGSSMAYGYDKDEQISNITSYTDITVDGTNVGMSWDQLAIGVQAGPGGGWMTGIDEVYALAQWCVKPDSPAIRGMMLFTFSQDIQQFTHAPQNSPSKMFPNEYDHQWQRTIIAGFLGEPQPSD